MADTHAKAFPPGFWWGCATAAHQVEGNNINSDLWVLEHSKPTIFAEPSGDACDHYHRYRDDIRLLAFLGFNAYRFSIEWARVEPEPGFFSAAEIAHYRRMAAACRERGVAPVATFSHFTIPRWLAAQGGWESPAAADHFVRFCERAGRALGDLLGAACTFNEPNVPYVIRWMGRSGQMMEPAQAMLAQAARAVGSDRFGSFFLGDAEKTRDNMLAAHRRAADALKSGLGSFPVGVTLSISDDQPAGADSARDRKRAECYAPWLDAARHDDFIGVQTYTRARVGPDGDLPPEPGGEGTQIGFEFWPEALEQTVRYAASQTGVPVIVTENGIATDDDSRRIEYIQRALRGLHNCVRDGLDVRGYFHWSLLDNFEWMFGFRPKFGLISVDRETQERQVKPSARFLGEIAKQNAIPAPQPSPAGTATNR
jgi:beta-glucosidase